MGASYADSAASKLGVCEFVDNDQFSNLEVIIILFIPYFRMHVGKYNKMTKL